MKSRFMAWAQALALSLSILGDLLFSLELRQCPSLIQEAGESVQHELPPLPEAAQTCTHCAG